MSADHRTHRPRGPRRWVLVVAWLVVIGRVAAAGAERFAAEAMAGSLVPDARFTGVTQVFASRVSSRDLVLALALGAALALHEWWVAGWLLAAWAAVESLDWLWAVFEVLDDVIAPNAFLVPVLPVMLAVTARSMLVSSWDSRA